MKNTKKLTAMIAALTLTACSIAPMASFADSFDLSIVSTNELSDKEISNVVAYKVFEIHKETTGVTVTGWGDGVDVDKVLESLQADATFNNADGANAFADITHVKDATEENPDTSYSDVAKIVSGFSDNGAEAKAFARAVAKNATGDGKTGTFKDGTVSFTDALADGYYVVTCEVESDDNNDVETDENKNKSVSLGMLTVADGEVTQIGVDGYAKVGLPTVQKKVVEDDKQASDPEPMGIDTNKSYNDGADWAIGQTQNFKLYGTLPDNYADYDTYYYEFHDSLATQFDAPAETDNFVVKVVNKGSEDVVLTAGTDYVLNVKAGSGTTNHEISVKFTNLKAITSATINKDTVITVEYSTALNKTAVVGANGQENDVYLEYSNNPNKSGSGENDNDHGETPKDRVIVFTYALEFNKTFVESGSDLTKDEIVKGTYDDIYFTLKDGDKYVTVAEYDGDEYDYYIVGSEETLSENSKLKLHLVDSDKKKVSDETKESWSSKEDVPNGTELVIRIKGLDSATYVLDEEVEEEKTFEYNTVDDQNVEIKTGVKFKQNWDGATVTDDDATTEKEIYEEIKYTFGTGSEKTATKTGTADGEIENKKGSSLPTTGGMGTTLFYLGGGAMVAVAGVFLITKKRMGKSEN